MRKLGSLSPRALALLAALLTAAVVVAGFVVVMSQSEPRRAGTNSILGPSHAIVPPGGELCQTDRVPAGSGAVAPRVVPEAPAGVTATVERDGQPIARGRAGRVVNGATLFGFDRPIDRELQTATICFQNGGDATLRVYGDIATGGPGASAPQFANGVPVLVRLDWYRPGSETGWQLMSDVADRNALLKAPFLGPWALWVALAVLLGLSAAGVALVLREARE
jgi:hypothetical protein